MFVAKNIANIPIQNWYQSPGHYDNKFNIPVTDWKKERNTSILYDASVRHSFPQFDYLNTWPKRCIQDPISLKINCSDRTFIGPNYSNEFYIGPNFIDPDGVVPESNFETPSIEFKETPAALKTRDNTKLKLSWARNGIW